MFPGTSYEAVCAAKFASRSPHYGYIEGILVYVLTPVSFSIGTAVWDNIAQPMCDILNRIDYVGQPSRPYTDSNPISTCLDVPSAESVTLSGPTETRPTGTGGTSEITLTAKVTDGVTPKPGVALSFTVDVTANSGGHDHDSASRPKGTLSVAQGTSDANGEVKFKFKASDVAGIHTIKATCTTCSNSPAV